MIDRIITATEDWAVASDKLQWILMRWVGHPSKLWDPVSFVRSTKDILARCMREKGVDTPTAIILLEGLPDTFDEFLAHGGTRQSPNPTLKTGTDH
jgi:hypothetical protein